MKFILQGNHTETHGNGRLLVQWITEMVVRRKHLVESNLTNFIRHLDYPDTLLSSSSALVCWEDQEEDS